MIWQGMVQVLGAEAGLSDLFQHDSVWAVVSRGRVKGREAAVMCADARTGLVVPLCAPSSSEMRLFPPFAGTPPCFNQYSTLTYQRTYLLVPPSS